MACDKVVVRNEPVPWIAHERELPVLFVQLTRVVASCPFGGSVTSQPTVFSGCDNVAATTTAMYPTIKPVVVDILSVRFQTCSKTSAGGFGDVNKDEPMLMRYQHIARFPSLWKEPNSGGQYRREAAVVGSSLVTPDYPAGPINRNGFVPDDPPCDSDGCSGKMLTAVNNR